MPHNEQQCHCADVGMRITVQMQTLAFQARVWTRPATSPAPALLVTKRVPAQNTITIARGRVAARQLPSDNGDHASSGVIKFEETVLCECHSGYNIDGSPDVNKSFTTTCGVAASGYIGIFIPLLATARRPLCHKVTCGIPLLASFGAASVGSEVSFHDVVNYSGERSHRDGLGKRRFSGRRREISGCRESSPSLWSCGRPRVSGERAWPRGVLMMQHVMCPSFTLHHAYIA